LRSPLDLRPLSSTPAQRPHGLCQSNKGPRDSSRPAVANGFTKHKDHLQLFFPFSSISDGYYEGPYLMGTMRGHIRWVRWGAISDGYYEGPYPMGTMRGGEKEKEKKLGTIISKNGMSAERHPPPPPPNYGRQNTACNVPSNYTLKESNQETSDHSHPSSNLHPPTWLREQELLFHPALWMIPCLEQTWWWFHVSRHWWCSWILWVWSAKTKLCCETCHHHIMDHHNMLMMKIWS
jgi:hypothetical protein